MAKATKKNQAIMATMSPALNVSLLNMATAHEDIAVNVSMESARILAWEASVHYAARVKAGRGKNADERAKQDAAALREERKAFIAALPYAGNIRKCNSVITRAIADFIGKNGTPRYKAFESAYTAYVAETSAMNIDRAETIAALAGILHTVVKTDKVNERLLAARIVPCLGACKAGKGDVKQGNKSGIRVMKRAEFVRMVMLCLHSLAVSGKCSELFLA